MIIPQGIGEVHHEIELGVVMGKTCSKLTTEDRWQDYVAGYCLAVDMTARDVQTAAKVRQGTAMSLHCKGTHHEHCLGGGDTCLLTVCCCGVACGLYASGVRLRADSFCVRLRLHPLRPSSMRLRLHPLRPSSTGKRAAVVRSQGIRHILAAQRACRCVSSARPHCANPVVRCQWRTAPDLYGG